MIDYLVRDGSNSPVMIDDVTVQSDAARTEKILAMLYEMSKTHQIVFFSQEDEGPDMGAE